ncbi:hypothetical protein GCM10009645_06420 [Mycolicibacterium poriferae]|uniref:Cadherin domain-containing protein n=1 Tax=Mycolicibacterium poriferae TaxID=39694 RepID=A0A6N4V4L9_9MYCO|nr:tandem-95 repeat protein [Mycolicibacterium poriferae]BBX49734.1 hypothetical protein MPOR_07600 [Mycolicibacterium poriferae]
MSKQRLGHTFVSTGSTTRGARSAADCIGRVGGLAAALGVGAMLFVAPWAAAAETEGASGASESSATSEPDSNKSATTNDPAAEGADADETPATSDDGSDGDTDTDTEAEELDAELSEEIAEELEEELENEDASSSGDDDAIEEQEADEAAEAIVDEAVDEVEDVAVDSGGSRGSVAPDTGAPEVVADDSEPAIEDAPAEPIETTSAPTALTEPAGTEPASSRSSYTSASVMSARTSTEEITEAPAKALQAQPGTFLEVASSMLSAVIAPFVTTPAAPAAPSAQPLMWGVLSWVRRELDDTFANFSISIGGRQIVQNGTAYATSQGFGSFAIAHGENAVASASGLFNVAIVRGDDSTATSEGNFTRVRVRGDDNTAGADGPGSRASIYGDQNTAETTGAYTSIYVRGVGNAVTGTGDGTRATVTGDDNDATVLATNGSRAQITVRGDENSATASAEDDSTALVRIIGDGSTAVADADADGYAAARITGDSNVASSDALGETSIARITGDDSAASANAVEARAEAITYGDGNAAEANDGKAVISGDSSSATANGPGSLARVWGDRSTASALGEQNTAFVWGDDSRAVAGPGIYNNALTFGNNLLADTGPGDGRTVYGQPFDPENQAPVAGTPGAQTVDPETGAVTGTLGFTDPDGDTLTYTASTPANGSVTLNAAAGTYTYTPATRPDFGDPDGADAFTVTATDPAGLSASTTIDVPVTALPEPGNQAPQAGTPGEQTVDPGTGTVTGALGFTDPDGDPLTYEVTEQPDNGVVTVDNEAGTYTYTPETRPEPGQPDGEDSFTVVASDPDGLTATNTIGLPIVALPEPDNQAPVAGTPGEQTVNPETGSISGSLGFTDPDGDELTYTATDPTNGSVTIDAQAGTYTYTPATRPEAGEPDGADAFTVTATDPDGLSASTTIDVPVTALPDPDNNAPVPGDLGEQTVDPETGAVTATFSFTDPDGDDLTYTVSTPANGTVTLDAQTGTYTYTPDPEARPAFGQEDGVDAFTLTASDGQASSTIGIEVPVTALPEPDNQAPVAGTPGEQTVDPETGSVTGSLGFTDPDGDDLTYTVYAEPANGSVTFDAVNGTYTYTPATRPDFGEEDGADVFTVIATDPGGLSAMTTINVPVVALPEPDNQAPVAGTPGEQTVDPETGTVTGTLGFTDPDDDQLAYTVTNDPGNGSITINPDGSFSYTPTSRPAAGEPDGADAFTVTATDPDGLSASTTINVPVAAQPESDTTPTLQGIAELEGDPHLPPVIGPDGTAYQVVVFGVGTSNQHTSVYALNPDGSVPQNPVVDMAEGGADSTLKFAPERFAYVTTFDYDSQEGNLLVIDLQNPGTFSTVLIGNDRIFSDDLSISPDGSAYVLSGGQLVVVDPENTSDPAMLALTGIDPDGPVMFNQSNGTPYLTNVPTLGAERVQIVEIDITSPADPLTVVAESPGQMPSGGFVSAPDGSIYLTTWTADDDTATTHVVLLDPVTGSPTQFEIGGSPFHGVALGPDGAAYQTSAEIFIEGDDFSTLKTITDITRIDPAQAGDPLVHQIEGALTGQVLVGPTGTIYAGVTVTDFSGFPETVTTEQLVVIDPQNPGASFAVELEGRVVTEDIFDRTNIVVGQDGRAYVVINTETEVNGEFVYTTSLTVVDPENPATTIRVDLETAGSPPNQGSIVAVDSNGIVYVTTETLQPGGFLTEITVIDPDNPTDPVLATYQIDGNAIGGPIIDPGNTAYQTTVGGGVDDELTNAAVIGIGQAQNM